MHSILAILLVASTGAVVEGPASDTEDTVTTAPSEAATAPTVLSSKETGPSDTAQDPRGPKPERWPQAFQKAKTGGWVGAAVTVIIFTPLILSAPSDCGGRDFLCFTQSDFMIGGAIFGTMITAVSSAVYGIIGYRSTEAEVRRYDERSIDPAQRQPVSRYGWLQLPLLLGPFATAYLQNSGVGWRKWRAGADHPSVDLWSDKGVAASLTLAAQSVSSAFLFHWGRPIGADGQRQSSWGQAALLAMGSFALGFSSPAVNRMSLGDQELEFQHHRTIWRQATVLAVAGLLATDWGLSKLAD